MLDLTLADAQKDTNPMRPDFRFKVVAQDPTPILPILPFLGTNLDKFTEIVHPRIFLNIQNTLTKLGDVIL